MEWIIGILVVFAFIILAGAGIESHTNDLKKSGKCWCPQTEGYDGPYYFCDPCLDQCLVCNPQNSPKDKFEKLDINRPCSKCGSTSVSVNYLSAPGELIRRDCKTCGFQWAEWSLDKE